jgi:hypothetical protein
MENQNLYHCFTFSEEQVIASFEARSTRLTVMECFMSLVDLAEPVAKLVQISKNQAS